jgi:hypothetical protein
LESVGDFAVRHAGTLVEVNDGSLGVGAQLALSHAGGVVGLQRMPATQALAALLAMAAVDVELADDGLAGNVRLELLIEMILDDVAAAVGTVIGQGRVKRFSDLLGRRLAMAVLAVLVASLAARLLGMLLRCAFGEGSRLPLGRAFDLLKTMLQIANDLLEPGVLRAKLLIFEEQLFVRRCVHADLDSEESCQLYEIIAIVTGRGKVGLNNHRKLYFSCV